MNSINQDAEQLLVDLDLYRVPVNPVEICKKLGIFYKEIPYSGVDGTLIVLGDQQIIGVNSNIIDNGRKAFTCAHEIGHSFYDITDDVNFNCTRSDLGYGSKLDQKEIRANDFASALLLPKDLFLSQIENQSPSWELLKKLSKEFQTSLQATTNRFVKLTHHICWLIIVKDGLIQRYTKADHNDFPPILKKYFTPPKHETFIFKETMAESWFKETRKIKNKKLLFCSLPENQYGETPILLWDSKNMLHNDIYEEDEHEKNLSY